jgi:hypothetical protein
LLVIASLCALKTRAQATGYAVSIASNAINVTVGKSFEVAVHVADSFACLQLAIGYDRELVAPIPREISGGALATSSDSAVLVTDFGERKSGGAAATLTFVAKAEGTARFTVQYGAVGASGAFAQATTEIATASVEVEIHGVNGTAGYAVIADGVTIADERTPLADKSEAANWVNPFPDVSPSDWFYGSVEFAVTRGLMLGTAPNAFEPNAAMTRAMLATVLYRFAGEPEVGGGMSFTDVAADAWYSGAVDWVSARGIMIGYGDGTFGVQDDVTREQLAVALMRFVALTGTPAQPKAAPVTLTDLGDASDWARDGVEWAAASGLMVGRTATAFVPAATATRAEVATVITRLAATP